MATTKPKTQSKAAKNSETESLPTHEVILPCRIHGKNKNTGEKLTLTDAQARLFEHQKKLKRL
ncbi:hypothetical protein GTG28_20725 [Vibrio sp. OCN044]|uniref:Uncharacterized protein n=1 Tax=Vibrio tetraodonis subsp. pristinus TaxID=2695891 RepID=A0A6L8M5L0_9VIBR|nr:hypothetical protein [Vibrio tetraodonis]MYM61629.1 hypothetical protein [Vibrio tetraodonis subsp. pristinus]